MATGAFVITAMFCGLLFIALEVWILCRREATVNERRRTLIHIIISSAFVGYCVYVLVVRPYNLGPLMDALTVVLLSYLGLGLGRYHTGRTIDRLNKVMDKYEKKVGNSSR